MAKKAEPAPKEQTVLAEKRGSVSLSQQFGNPAGARTGGDTPESSELRKGLGLLPRVLEKNSTAAAGGRMIKFLISLAEASSFAMKEKKKVGAGSQEKGGIYNSVPVMGESYVNSSTSRSVLMRQRHAHRLARARTAGVVAGPARREERGGKVSIFTSSSPC